MRTRRFTAADRVGGCVRSVPWRLMDRDATFLLALVLFAAAALAVGASGWVLWARDHRLAKAASAAAHHEVAEER